MEKLKKEIRVGAYTDILKRYLLSRGIKYDENQTVYYFQVAKQNCCLEIKDSKIKIENHTTKKIDIYDFAPTNEAVLTHGRFRSEGFEQLGLTQSEVYLRDERVFITTAAAQLETPVVEEKCSHKILFLSDSLMGNTIYDTLDNIESLDGSRAYAFTHDLPRVASPKLVVPVLLHNEALIYSDMSKNKTR